jgi:hypothetical protein
MKNLEALIAANDLTPSVVALAQKQIQDNEQKRKVDAAVTHLQNINRDIQKCVENVRAYRKAEKTALGILRKVTTAQAQFLKDGDVDAYNKATRGY